MYMNLCIILIPIPQKYLIKLVTIWEQIFKGTVENNEVNGRTNVTVEVENFFCIEK